jgi:hypothetical protein
VTLRERMELIAREEVARVLGDRSAPDRAQLQQQITDLHEHLHQAATTISRLETRVDALEKAAAEPAVTEPLPRRTRRKLTESDS